MCIFVIMLSVAGLVGKLVSGEVSFNSIGVSDFDNGSPAAIVVIAQGDCVTDFSVNGVDLVSSSFAQSVFISTVVPSSFSDGISCPSEVKIPTATVKCVFVNESFNSVLVVIPILTVALEGVFISDVLGSGFVLSLGGDVIVTSISCVMSLVITSDGDPVAII